MLGSAASTGWEEIEQKEYDRIRERNKMLWGFQRGSLITLVRAEKTS